MIISSLLKNELIAAGRAALPREAVGLIFPSTDVIENGTASFHAGHLHLLENLSESHESFRLDPVEFASVIARYARPPLALFHSHPTDIAAPSTADVHGADGWTRLLHLILSLRDDPKLACWRIFDGQVLPEEIVYE